MRKGRGQLARLPWRGYRLQNASAMAAPLLGSAAPQRSLTLRRDKPVTWRHGGEHAHRCTLRLPGSAIHSRVHGQRSHISGTRASGLAYSMGTQVPLARRAVRKCRVSAVPQVPARCPAVT